MDLVQLKTIVAIRREGSFTKAAAELHLTQPAISGHVRRLEQELGVRLFERAKSGCLPTPAGETLVRRAQEILRIERSLRRELATKSSTVPVRFQLACGEFLGSIVAPEMVSRLRARFPSSQIDLEIGFTSSEMIEGLRRQKLDLALLMLPPGFAKPADLGFEQFATEELWIVCDPKSAVARSRPKGEALGHAVWLLNQRGRGMRSMIERMFESRGWTLRACTVDRIAAMKELVKTGMGVAALPEHFVADDVRRGRLRRLSGAGLELAMEITAAWRRGETSDRWVGAALRAARAAVEQTLC